MVAVKFLTCVALAGSVVSASAFDEDWVLGLVKRQQPGTPQFACHESCGNAIIASRQPNSCENPAFKTPYEACLACAGPDRVNIWRFYGATLSAAGEKCGFPTTPESGEEPGEPTVTPPTSTPTTTPTPETTTPSSPETTTTPAGETSTPVTSAEPTPSETSTHNGESSSAGPPAAQSTTSGYVAPTTTVASTGTGLMPTASGNGTAHPTSPSGPEFTGAASQHFFGMGTLAVAILAFLA